MCCPVRHKISCFRRFCSMLYSHQPSPSRNPMWKSHFGTLCKCWTRRQVLHCIISSILEGFGKQDWFKRQQLEVIASPNYQRPSSVFHDRNIVMYCLVQHRENLLRGRILPHGMFTLVMHSLNPIWNCHSRSVKSADPTKLQLPLVLSATS